MANINFGQLMSQLGSIFGCLKDIYAFQNGTWLTDLDNVVTQLANYQVALQGSNFLSDLQSLNGLNGPLVTDLSSNLTDLQALAQQLVQQTVQAVSPPSFNVSLTAAVAEMYRQWVNQGQTI